MAVYELSGNPSWRSVLAAKLARSAQARSESATRRTESQSWLQSMVRLLLHLGGFACLTLAGFSFNFAIGMVIAGLSCFVFSWLTSTQSNNSMSGHTANQRDQIIRR